FRDRLACEGIDGLSGEPNPCLAAERSEIVERLRRAIDNSTQELRSDTHGAGASAWNDSRVRSEAVCVPCGHQIEPVAGKPNNLRLDARSVAGDDVASVANRCMAADCFERKSDHSSEGALDRRGRSAFH